MASIVQRNKSFCVVYTMQDSLRRRQKWETYHSYAAALWRKEQVELSRRIEKEKAQRIHGNLEKFLEEYVALYGQSHWSCSTYTSNIGLIRNDIVPFIGTMSLVEFTPRVIAVLYSKWGQIPNMTPALLRSIHKLLHSAFEQAVLWEYLERNPFHKVTVPQPFPAGIKMLSPDEVKQLLASCENLLLCIAVHLAFAGSLRKGEILALTWEDVDFLQILSPSTKRSSVYVGMQ